MVDKIVPFEMVEKRIYFIRNKHVMLDTDLSELYGISTKRLNEQVKRNIKRFPESFMFRLSGVEFRNLRSQFATSKRGGRRYLPYVFTEHGVLMLANVINSDVAVSASLQIIETFVKLREFAYAHKDLAQKLSQLERKYERHDEQIQAIFNQIRGFMQFKDKPKRQIGFKG